MIKTKKRLQKGLDLYDLSNNARVTKPMIAVSRNKNDSIKSIVWVLEAKDSISF
jgi:hypothetical protein